MNLHWIDLLVIAAYFAVTLVVGLRFSRQNRSTDRYYLGGRSFPGWAVGLSFIGGTISSVTFTAYPADSFKTSWVRLLPNLAFPLVALLAAWLFVPFFRGGRARSAYHYLHLRFGAPVSVYAALVYLAAQLVRMATITYLLAVLLSNLLGIDLLTCAVLVAGFTGLYATKGGFEAVVWTEVLQTIVLMAGALCCVLVVLHAVPGGFAEVWSHAVGAGKISFRDLNPASGLLEPLRGAFSFSEKTAAMLVLVGATQYLAGQLDQDTVQRWCAAKSAREARKSMWVLGLGALPIWTTFMFLGTCLWVFFQQHPDEVSRAVLGGTRKAEDILPHFIITALPHGVAGLVISAALAAGMSSLGTCVSAAGMVWVNDLYRKHAVRDRDDAHYLRVGKLSSVMLSLLMMGGAALFHFADSKTLMDTSIAVTAMFGGGIAGAFLFGIFTRLGDHRAVLAGMAATLAFTAYAALMQFKVLPRSFDPYYTAIFANLVMFAVCGIAAKCLPAAPRDLAQLTIWDRAARHHRPRFAKIFGLIFFAIATIASAQTPAVEHHLVYHGEKEFAAWPANEGLWSWDDEILVGFNVARFEERGEKHSFVGDQAVTFARSLDGGATWTIERHENVLPPAKLASPTRHQPSPANIDFTHPDFAMKLRGRFFFTSTDRGHTWQGAYRVPDFGQGMDARTSYLVTGKSSCLFFIPCSVSDGRGTRIRSCAAETTDGGKTLHFLSWIGPDPLDGAGAKVRPGNDDVSSTMPSVVRMDDGWLVCALRNRVKSRKWSSIEESTDGGRTWRSVTTLEKGCTNPVTLVRLGGPRIAAVYGNRRSVPCRLSAKLSDDGGQTWGEEITLRADGRKWDLGYTRAALRPDGRLTILYYFSTDAVPQQHIEATIWKP